MVPMWLILSLCAGAAVAYFVPATFYAREKLEVPVAVYAAIFTMNGLILALSWGAFGRIYEIISSSGFTSYLLENKLLNGYIFYVSFVHITQIAAIVITFGAMIVLLCLAPSALENQISFGLMCAASIYSVKTAVNAVRVMQDLVWQKAVFDRGASSQQDSKVTRIK
jgi:hypothetical protein